MPIDYFSLYGIPKLHQMSAMDNTGLAANLNTTNPNAATLAANLPTSNAGPNPTPGGFSSLTPEQIAAARGWINQNAGSTVSYDAAGNPLSLDQIMARPSLVASDKYVPGNFQFNGDFGSIFGNGNPASIENTRGLAANILGAGQGMGYGSNELADILGFTPDQITQFRDSYFPDQYANDGYRNSDVDRASLQFAQDQGWTTARDNRNNLTQNGGGFGWVGGADGGYSTSMRSPFGTERYAIGGDPILQSLQDRTGRGPENRNWARSNDSGMVGGSTQDWARQDGGPNGGMPMGGFAPSQGGIPGSFGGIPGLPGAPTLNTSYTPSPYLQGQIGRIGDQISDQFNTQILPGIRSNAQMSVTFGGAKHGVAEGIAAGRAADAFNNASMNLLGTDYTNALNRQLQQYGMDQGYGLGVGNLALGNLQSNRGYDLGLRGQDLQRYGMDQNYSLGLGGLNLQNQGQQLGFFTNQRGQDLQQLGLGANIYNMGTMGPWNTLGAANSLYAPWSGYGTSTTNAQSGGGWGGALGGLMAGGSFANNMGWFR